MRVLSRFVLVPIVIALLPACEGGETPAGCVCGPAGVTDVLDPELPKRLLDAWGGADLSPMHPDGCPSTTPVTTTPLPWKAGAFCDKAADCTLPAASPPGLRTYCEVATHACRYALTSNAEPLRELQRLYRGVQVYHARKHRLDMEGKDLGCTYPSESLTTPLDDCCKLGKEAAERVCPADPLLWSQPEWSDLRFQILGAHRFQYAQRKKAGGPWEALATVDSTCGGCKHTFSVSALERAEDGCRLDKPNAVHYRPGDDKGTWSAEECGAPLPEMDLALTTEQQIEFTFPSKTGLWSDSISGPLNPAYSPSAFIPMSLNPHYDEVKTSLDVLAKGAASYWESGTAGACSFPIAAPTTPAEGSCCSAGNLKGHDTDGDQRCDPSAGAWTSVTWKDLGFAIPGSHVFVYSTALPDAQTFYAQARGDMDCDGYNSTFRVFVRGTQVGTGCVAEIVDGFYAEEETE